MFDIGGHLEIDVNWKKYQNKKVDFFYTTQRFRFDERILRDSAQLEDYRPPFFLSLGLESL